MSYSDDLSFLFRLTNQGIKLGLENSRAFLKHLQRDEPQGKIIHIAGTNGKGSTAIMLHDILKDHGKKVGLFSSPHIQDYRERFRINGNLISQSFVQNFIRTHQNYIRDNGLTFFEVCTVLALDFFESESCDYIILETGMGGRLDATNCFKPVASLITSVSLDHQSFLGESIEEIAAEKAGIIKKAIPIFSAEQENSIKTVINNTAKKMNAPFIDLTLSYHADHYFLPLFGEHQKRNAHSAFSISKFLLNHDFKASIATHSLAGVKWAGRLEQWGKNKQVFLDVSHNPVGVQHSLKSLNEQFLGKSFSVIFAFLSDKNSAECLKLLQAFSEQCYLYPLKHERFDISQFSHFPIFEAKRDIAHFLAETNSDYLLVIGSHFLLAAFLDDYS